MRKTRRVEIDGVAVAVADDEGGFWDRVARGLWEPTTLAAIRNRVRPGSIFLDLGAWVGPLSLYAAALGAQVVAVEADPAALVDLRGNVAANPGLAERIRIVPRAVAPESGPVRLGAHRRAGDSMSSTLLAKGAAVSWTAEAVTPADLATLVGSPSGLVVKVDIEGGEYALLPALAPLLGSRPLACLVSFHPALLDEGVRESATAAAVSIFAGYRVSPLGGTDPASGPVEAAAALGTDTWLFEAGLRRAGGETSGAAQIRLAPTLTASASTVVLNRNDSTVWARTRRRMRRAST